MEFYISPLLDKNNTSFVVGIAHHSDNKEVQLYLGLIALIFKYK